jgi:NADH:ubiquinone oxidoreductase subunit 5 (subunit L)/multisubunit Na+/H+ antiporter MnhA subunit
MYTSIIFIPLIGSISAGFFGRKLGVKGSQLLTSSAILITTLLAITSFIEVGLNNASVSIQLFK